MFILALLVIFSSILEIFFGNIPDIPCKIFREWRKKSLNNSKMNIMKTRSSFFQTAQA